VPPAGGATTAEDLQYSDDDRSKGQEKSSDSTSEPTASGGTLSWSESTSGNDKAKYHDGGERDITASGTTDDGTATNTDHGTGSFATQTDVTYPGGETPWGEKIKTGRRDGKNGGEAAVVERKNRRCESCCAGGPPCFSRWARSAIAESKAVIPRRDV
jgi:hypothetical protein